MPVELGSDVLNAVHSAQQSGDQISDLKLVDKLDQIVAADRILKRIRGAADVRKALAVEECSEEDKLLILKLIEADRERRPDLFDYRLNVILSNDAVFKSLTLKLEIRIKDVEVELSVDGLSDLRYEVARAIHRMQHYQY